MCQNEVAHHANRCPEYFCPRPEKWVYLYKKGLAIGLPAATKKGAKHSATGQSEETSATGPRVTAQRSDVDLYECRTQYTFWPVDTHISPHLPAQGTPEAQVAAANVWEFFPFRAIPRRENPLAWNGTCKQLAHRHHVPHDQADRGA